MFRLLAALMVMTCSMTCFSAVTRHVPVGQCVSDCTGVDNGRYQSCQGCDVYVWCGLGMTFDNRPCPPNLVWSDQVKRCEFVSYTCRTSGDKNGCTDDKGDSHEIGDYWLSGWCTVFNKCILGESGWGEVKQTHGQTCNPGDVCQLAAGKERCDRIYRSKFHGYQPRRFID